MVLLVQRKPYRVVAGVGAGAGAAFAMIVIMGALRVGFAFPTIPELMLQPILRLLGGQAFSNALGSFYYAARPLLFTLILEGTLLLGALLGLIYARIARPHPVTGRRLFIFNNSLGGIAYGLLIGVLLNTLFLPLLDQDVFATDVSGIFTEGPIPLWAGLMFLALIFGVTLHRLLPAMPAEPSPFASGQAALIMGAMRVDGRPVDRRYFLRVAGGTLLAAISGAAFWYGGTLLNQGDVADPVSRIALDDSSNNSGQGRGANSAQSTISADTPTAYSTEPANPTEVPPPMSTDVPRITPTEAPAAIAQPSETSQPVIAQLEPSPAAPQAATEAPNPTSAPPTPATPTTEPPRPAEPTAQPTARPPDATPQPPRPPTAQPPSATSQPPAPPTATIKPPAVAAPRVLPLLALQEITPTGSFYHVSKNFFDPSPSSAGWKLTIKGLVDNQYSLTYDQLTALPAKVVTAGMMCISNPVGGGLAGNATWKGVPLADLLNKARPRKGVVDVAMQAIDGYSDSITLKKAMDPDVMLVWEMNGAPLTSQHGFPARLLVPGIYGMKHAKWLTSFELVNYDFKGFWQQPDQGWSDTAQVNTMSRIDSPAASGLSLRTQTLAGIAFAGNRGISKVEVSTDGGQSWGQAYIKPPASHTSWVVWAYEWTPASPGKYAVQVRATDGTGAPQISRRADPYPNGATGYHKVTYLVK